MNKLLSLTMIIFLFFTGIADTSLSQVSDKDTSKRSRRHVTETLRALQDSSRAKSDSLIYYIKKLDTLNLEADRLVNDLKSKERQLDINRDRLNNVRNVLMNIAVDSGKIAVKPMTGTEIKIDTLKKNVEIPIVIPEVEKEGFFKRFIGIFRRKSA